MRPRFLAAAALALGCALPLSGCAAMTGELAPYKKPVSEAQLVGTWNGDCDAKLVIGSDHKLTTTGFPTGADSQTLKITSRFTGSGSWAMVERFGDLPAHVNLDLDNTPNDLDYAAGHDGSLVLAVTVGDPNDGVGCRFTPA
ncbi:hypothetical protein [Streptomyces sp. NPDC086787]|uniref:hypothetical protein n=1 Tax=Streptomyces sp. NPDC086787 TaxID=3365759 RepID=UPI0038283963